MNELDSLVAQAKHLFAACSSPTELENAKAQFFGKAGHLTTLMKSLSSLDVDAKKAQGALINAAKQSIEQALNDCRQQLAQAELQAQLKAETFDVSLPSLAMAQGGLSVVLGDSLDRPGARRPRRTSDPRPAPPDGALRGAKL